MTLKGKLAEKLEIIDLYPIDKNEMAIKSTEDIDSIITEASPNIEPSKNRTTSIKNSSNRLDKMIAIVPDFAITLKEAKERINMLQNFVNEMMIPNVDYGLIPKCKKPSLFKSGAEKLCDIFGFSKRVEVINRLEDWDKGIFHYEVKATLLSKITGYIEAEGVGSCNSKEGKYSKQNPFSIVNTILKMAKKRALIDAVLSATRSSGIFTQDVEDIYRGTDNYTSKNSFSTRNIETYPTTNKVDTKELLNELYTLVSIKNIEVKDMKRLISKKYKVRDSKELSTNQIIELVNYLKGL